MKSPRTGNDFTVSECLIMIAGLCDAIKRLELAIESGDREYVKEATLKRIDVQERFLGKQPR